MPIGNGRWSVQASPGLPWALGSLPSHPCGFSRRRPKRGRVASRPKASQCGCRSSGRGVVDRLRRRSRLWSADARYAYRNRVLSINRLMPAAFDRAQGQVDLIARQSPIIVEVANDGFHERLAHRDGLLSVIVMINTNLKAQLPALAPSIPPF